MPALEDVVRYERLDRSGAALGSADEPPRPAEVQERRGFPELAAAPRPDEPVQMAGR